MKKNPKLLVVALLVFALILSAAPSVPVEAKTTSKNYYSDVKSGCKYKSQIEWLAKKGAYKSIATKGKKFQPDKVLTRKELGTILTNLYGKRIDITIKGPKKPVTQQYLANMLAKVSKQLGHKVKLSCKKPNSNVTRAFASNNIVTMIKKDSKLSVGKQTTSDKLANLSAYIHNGKFSVLEYSNAITCGELYSSDGDVCFVFPRRGWFVQTGHLSPSHPNQSYIIVGVWDESGSSKSNFPKYVYTCNTGETIATDYAGNLSVEALSHLVDTVNAMKATNDPNTAPSVAGITFSYDPNFDCP